MFSGFQSSVFQNNAFQISNNKGYLGGGGNVRPELHYEKPYLLPYQAYLLEEEKKAKIKSDKQNLKLVQTQIDESEARYSLLVKKLQKEILELQDELRLQQQISQLRILRAELIQRIQEDEAFLVILLEMRRRKLRAG